MIKVYQPIKDQADAAIKSADAALKQAINSERTFLQAQRAWVGPRNATFAAEPAVGKAIEMTVEYQNSGHEPAISFVYSVDSFAMEPAEEANGTVADRIGKSMSRENKERHSGNVIYPATSGFGASPYSISARSKDDLVDEAVVKGDKLVVVQGCFWYETIDLPKHAYFCYFYKQGFTKIQNLNICVSGQEAD
jgi:hypothetical protein